MGIEGDYTYLRINFFHPGASVGKDGFGYATTPDASFLKELTYRSTNVKEPGEIHAPSSNLNTAFRLIKDIQKKYKTGELFFFIKKKKRWKDTPFKGTVKKI